MGSYTYDLKANDVVIGGVLIRGYGPDDAVSYERAAPLGEITTGADGEHAFSRNNNDLWFVTLTLMETSQAYRDVASLYQAQQAETPIARLSYVHRDRINGDVCSSNRATFVEGPVPSKGKAVGTRSFRIALPGAELGAVFGGSIA